MQRKNILVLIDEKNNTEKFREWISDLFDDENLSIYVVNDENLSLVDKELVISDKVFNFLSGELFDLIQKKIESIKIDYFGNSLANIKLLSKKANFKHIIQLSEFKTAVFEKIRDRNAIELFNNFPQPSRIFSKTNHYFSGKLSSLDDIDKELSKIDNKNEFYIEEYIEGADIQVLFLKFKKNNFILPYFNDSGEYYPIEDEIREEIKTNVLSFIEKSELKDFAIFDLKFSKKRGLYFLNIFIENIDLYKNLEKINKFLKIQGFNNLKEVLKKNLF